MSASFDSKYIKFSTVTSGSLLSGLLLYWKLDDSTSPIADASGNGYTATATSVTYSQAGKVGTSFLFNGTSSTLALANAYPKPTTAMSFSFWIKTTSAADGSIAFCYSVSNYCGFYISYLNGQISFHLGDGTSGQEYVNGLDVTINDNAWHHVVFTWNGTIINGYVDGSNHLGPDTWSHSVPYTSIAHDSLYIMDNGYGDGYVGGNLDEFGIWNRELTSGEIANLYNSGSGKTHPF
jgi:hypothetical protein